MARKNHTSTRPLGSKNDYSVPGSAAFSFNTSDPVDKDETQMKQGRGGELLIARNTDTSAHTITIESVEDPFGRKSDVSYSIPARSFAAFGPFSSIGWRQNDGKLYFNADDSAVQFTVLVV